MHENPHKNLFELDYVFSVLQSLVYRISVIGNVSSNLYLNDNEISEYYESYVVIFIPVRNEHAVCSGVKLKI